MNLLIIPSWFGDEKSPNAGSFFEEEASLVAEIHNVTMLIFQRVSEDDVCLTSNSGVIETGKNGIIYIREFFCFYKGVNWETNIKNLREKVLSVFNKVFNYIPKPDLIHAYSTFYGGMCAYWISQEANMPYIITEHFSPFNLDFLHSDYVKKIMIESIEKAKKIACVSEFLRQQILMQNINCNPIVIGNYVNDRMFLIDANSAIKNRLLSVAYYPSYIKDLDTLFKAYRYLVDWKIPFSAVMVGGGEIKGGFNGTNIIERKVIDYNLADFVCVIGAATRKEMVRYMQECSLFVSSSIAESFGVSLCEAMMCGKVCVLTDNGGAREFITRANSICVNVHNPNALANALANALNNIDLYDCHEIRQQIVSKFGNKAFLARLNKLYNEIIDCKIQ